MGNWKIFETERFVLGKSCFQLLTTWLSVHPEWANFVETRVYGIVYANNEKSMSSEAPIKVLWNESS